MNNGLGTALNTAWTLSASGPTNISGTDGATAVTSAVVSAGTYTLSESGGPSGYTASNWSCTGATVSNGNQITVANGDNISCTLTNTYDVGTISFTKNTVGSDGTFSFLGSGTIGSFGMTTVNGSSTMTFTVVPGTYTITEPSAGTGWDKTSDTCSSIQVLTNQTTSCAITNTARGSIVVHENVLAPDGTTDVSDTHSFTVTLDGSDAQSVSESANHTYTYLTPGTYTIAQDTDADYDLVSITGGGSVTVSAGQSTDVYVVAKQKQGSLTVIKHVSNHGIGSSSAGNFTLTVVDANGHSQDVTGSETGTAISIDPGAYTVTESGPSGYAMTQSGCSTAMASNGTATCTVTNSDITSGDGAITVIKQLVSDNGGTALVSAFNSYLKIFDGVSTTTVSSGTANFLAASTTAYTVSEDDTSVLNYTFKSISCTDGTDTNTTGIIALADQASWVCTIVNDDVAPSLTLVKEVHNTHGGTAQASDWTLTATGPTTISGEGGATSGSDFQAGTYTLSESGGPSGYTAGTWSCTNDVAVSGDNTITLSIGQTTTCTITNSDEAGTLHVLKHVINDNGGTKTAHDFSFAVNGTGTTTFTQDAQDAYLGENDLTVDAGTYTVTEVPVDGYGATYDNCSNVTVANGGEATCTITNNDGQATLTIVKDTEGADGSFDFTVAQGENSTTTTLTTVNGTASTDIALDAGSYDVAEIVPTGWTLSGGHPTCVYDNASVGTPSIDNGEAITLDSGDHVTCTFDDMATGADLSITKSIDDTTPDHGQNVTYTLTAHNAGPASMEHVTVTDLLPSGLDFVSADGDYSTSTGEWMIESFDSGSTTVLHIVATVSAAQGATITNVATITGEDEVASELDTTNDTATSSVTVNTPATTPTGGGGGGGGNGPIVGSLGGIGGGQVLGISTSTTEQYGGSCERYLTKFIRMGGNNDPEQVKRLQYVLAVIEGYDVPQDGVFGQSTEDAVNKFQAKFASRILTPWGISSPTGYVYLTTRMTINEEYCHSIGVFPLSADEQKIIDEYRASHSGSGSGSGVGTTQPAMTSGSTTGSNEQQGSGEASSTDNADQAGAAAGSQAGGFWSGIKSFFSNLFHH